MHKQTHPEEANSDEEVIEREDAPKLILNENPWELDQHVNMFRNYNNLRKYKTLRGLERVQDYFEIGSPFSGRGPTSALKEASVSRTGLISRWAYRLLSGWYIFCAQHGKSVPTSKEILYFYKIKSSPMRGHKEKVGFYRLECYTRIVLCPTSSTKYTHDFRDYYFYTSDFPLKRVPTLSLDFNMANCLPQLPLTLELEERITFYKSFLSKEMQVEKLDALRGDLDEVKEAIAVITAKEALKAMKADE
uniref:Uncharacterized protein n=1 Tax=Cannabis sativa TaxID=3483 RepID=A0A803Q7E4_CANSA